MTKMHTSPGEDPVLALIRASGMGGFKFSTSADRVQAAETQDEASNDPVLALIRATGMTGFKSSSSEARARASRAATDASDDPALALVRAAGMGGFNFSSPDDRHEQPAGFRSAAPLVSVPTLPSHASRLNAAPVDQTMALIYAAGLPGFKPPPTSGNGGEPMRQQTATAWPVGLPAATPAAAKAPLAPPATIAAPPPPRSTGPDFAILHISQGGEKAFAALEKRMGTPFAAERTEGAVWAQATAPDGGTMRAFRIVNDQRVAITDLLGNLGSPSVRLSIGPINAREFKSAGPGASDWENGKGPPQLPQHLPTALRSALGGRKARSGEREH